MGGSAQAGRSRTAEEKERAAPFNLQEVRDEYLFLIPEEVWALKPLSLRSLIRLLEILAELFQGADSHWDALRKLDEELIAELIALFTRQPTEFVEEHWNFRSALKAVADFGASPEWRYLSAPPEEEPEAEEPQEPIAWVTDIVERLSRGRGWTVEYILDLPFLGILKLLESLDEKRWDESTKMIINVERGVGRAIAAALGKGDSLPALPSYRELKRRLKEAEAIKRAGRRFFEAATGE